MNTHGLRYSPVNDLIVNWSHHGQAFNNCGLPKPQPEPCARPSKEMDCCGTLAVLIEPDSIDWSRWLPEVIVGIEDPDEEIAANYVREAAIDFALRSRVLTRRLEIKLECGVKTYPIPCFDNERLAGLMYVEVSNNDQTCGPDKFKYMFDARQGTITIDTHYGSKADVVLFAVPNEDACAQDSFLYEGFRRPIAQEARSRYVRAVHFRDAALVRSLSSPQEFERSILSAKALTMVAPVNRDTQYKKGLFA